MRVLKMGVVGVCLLGLLAVPAQAELITIQIEGVVDTVEDDGEYLPVQIHVGDIITGWYTYDTDTPDSDPNDPAQGNYWHYSPPAGITLNIGELVFQTDPTNVAVRLAVWNDDYDFYSIGSEYNLPLPNGTSVETIGWALKDYSAQVFDDDSIPMNPPNLEYWDSNLLRVYGERAGYRIDGYITSAIPEPVSVLLFAIGSTMILAKRS